MKSRILAPLLVSVLLLTSLPPSAPAQTGGPVQAGAPRDWQSLLGLKPGKKVLVEFKNGSLVSGDFDSVSGNTLNLSGDGTAYALEQREILRVHTLNGRWSRRKTASVGAVVGLVVGAIIGGQRMSRLERDPNRIPSDADEIPLIAGISLGTLAGAGIGALLGGRRRGRLLYESR
ncbi:MAG TPA: hypothetical protein VJT09_02780 [Pyrinomonadaceae bacterium]|nr:hypothetical protein [Pyrinomonadaceae bacterium]